MRLFESTSTHDEPKTKNFQPVGMISGCIVGIGILLNGPFDSIETFHCFSAVRGLWIAIAILLLHFALKKLGESWNHQPATKEPSKVPVPIRSIPEKQCRGPVNSAAGSNKGLASHASHQSLSSFRNLTISSCRKLRKRGATTELVMANSNLFASMEDIEQLSLQDMAIIFRNASEVNLRRGDKPTSSLLLSASEAAKRVLASMDLAVTASRGQCTGTEYDLVEDSTPDALNVLAATRIFAEWRSIRLVPAGYKRYSMGVAMGRRDIIQNIGKVEQSVHSLIASLHTGEEGDDESEADDNGILDRDEQEVEKPSLRQVLQHEVDSGLHPRLPRLADSSGAIGLLWLKRQLDYQTAMMEKSLQVPSRRYRTTKDAVTDAYQEVYGAYHGWTTQQLFRQSFNGSPEFEEIWAPLATDLSLDAAKSPPGFISHDVAATMDSATTLLEPSGEVDRDRRQLKQEKEPNNSLVLVDNCSGWDRFVDNLGRYNCFRLPIGDPNPSASCRSLLQVFPYIDDLRQSSLYPEEDDDKPFLSYTDRTVSDVSSISTGTESLSPMEESVESSRQLLEQHIQMLCKELRKTLTVVDELLDEFNMHDPKKV